MPALMCCFFYYIQATCVLSYYQPMLHIKVHSANVRQGVGKSISTDKVILSDQNDWSTRLKSNCRRLGNISDLSPFKNHTAQTQFEGTAQTEFSLASPDKQHSLSDRHRPTYRIKLNLLAGRSLSRFLPEISRAILILSEHKYLHVLQLMSSLWSLV